MSNNSAAGFAIRRNATCLFIIGEVDCGATASPYRACCPHGAYCPYRNSYNAYCCDQPDVNCTLAIIQGGPFCANTTWTMYDNAGYFCCEPGAQGYDKNNTDGCAGPGYQLAKDEVYLSVKPQKAKPTISSTTQSQLPTSPPSSSKSSNNSADVGAIVGGSVGGVIVLSLIVSALRFYLIRKQRQKEARVIPYELREHYKIERDQGLGPTVELDGHGLPSELQGDPVTNAAELPDDSMKPSKPQ